jgi:hypothetical protein
MTTGGLPLGDPASPNEYDDAGPSDDLHRAYIASQVQRHRTAANQHFRNAQKWAGHRPEQAESEARRAIDRAARAFWWAEDTDTERAQHDLLHKIGRWTRRTFGCHFDYTGSEYRQTCPLAIAHVRVGISPGFVGKRSCSICGEDLSECPHIRGRSYWVRGRESENSECRVCHEHSCKHRSDRLYRAPVISRASSSEIREFSIVRRPGQPEARLGELPMPTEGLSEHLGPGFRPGMPVSCNRCLDPCPGIAELPESWGDEHPEEISILSTNDRCMEHLRTERVTTG